jgi:hypothetical protein
MRKEKYTPKEMIDALTAAKGMVYVAARKLECSAQTVYTYAEKYPAVKEAMKQERGLMVDIAEIALYKAVQNGEPWAVSLTLKTIGKDRGYTERQEITGADGGPLNVRVEDIHNLSDDELNAISQA